MGSLWILTATPTDPYEMSAAFTWILTGTSMASPMEFLMNRLEFEIESLWIPIQFQWDLDVIRIEYVWFPYSSRWNLNMLWHVLRSL